MKGCRTGSVPADRILQNELPSRDIYENENHGRLIGCARHSRPESPGAQPNMRLIR